MDRIILHCDLNSFYASVEMVFRPELRSVPMAVCGNPDNRHGIILAKNELAKKYNIKTAETIWSAKKKCPNLTLCPPHHDKYIEFSDKVRQIFLRYTDLVEPFGIDEAWLDVTESTTLFGDGFTMAHKIKDNIKQELGLTASIGVSFNKIFAKLGSDYKKPDAVTVISRENYKEIVYPLPVNELLYVGGKTQKKLHDLDIRTIGELSLKNREELIRIFGKQGNDLYVFSNGLYNDPVRKYDEQEEIKSIGNGITFPKDLKGIDEIKQGIYTLCETVAFRLRAHELKCGGVKITIKTPDFRVIDRQMQVNQPTNITAEIYDYSVKLMLKSWNPNNPIRLLTITAIQLIKKDAPEQIMLTEEDNSKRDKLEKLDKSVDNIRKKFGKTSIFNARTITNDIGLFDISDKNKEN